MATIPKTDQEIIALLKKGDHSVFGLLYKSKYALIEKLVIKKGGKKEDAKDIFQETLLAFYKNVKKENFTLTSAISTYLFAIANNLWLKEINKRIKRQEVGVSDSEFNIPDEDPEFELGLSEDEVKQQILKNIFQELKDPCKSLLVKFYFHKKTMKVIAQEMGYKSADAAKKQKFKCMSRVRKMAAKALAKPPNS